MKDTKQQWFKEAKFGLFIHWGLYSLLAGEYKGKKTDHIAEWIMNYLDIPVEEYEQLAKKFDPVNFDAEKIVKMAKDSGNALHCIYLQASRRICHVSFSVQLLQQRRCHSLQERYLKRAAAGLRKI